MNSASNKDDLIVKVAELLQMFDRVYYDIETLRFDGVMEEWLWNYGDYLDLDDEAFGKIGEDELSGWEREEVVGIRETLGLKSSIDRPESFISFKWMEEFTDGHANNQKFYDDAAKALHNRHPFRFFRSTLDRYGFTEQWYAYRNSRMEDHVRREMPELDRLGSEFIC